MQDFRLKVFLSVARNRSFTKASRELHITQPAVSKHIRELEEHYKARLFDRTGNNIALTKEGEVMYAHAERIMEEYNLLEFDMNQLSGTFSGELRLGASTTISQYVMPVLLSLFIKRYPDIKLSLISGNTREIEAALTEGRIDLGMVEGNHHNPSLRYARFMDDEIVLTTRTDSIYGKLDEITPDRLTSIPLVLREYGSGTLDVIEDKFSEHHLRLSAMNIVIHLGSTESIKAFLMQNDCAALVSIRSIFRELQAGTLKIIDIEGLDLKRTFKFVSQHGSPKPIAERFISFAEANNNRL